MLLFAFIHTITSAIVDLPGANWPTLDGKEISLFSHRGIKSQQPEHTTGSYWLSAINGVDYVEPDLVLTKDGIPVCYHDLYIKAGTDVLDHPEFQSKRRDFNDTLDGKPTTILNEFFISDFTLKELQTLRVVQKKIGVRPSFYDHLFHIPTLQEFLDTVNEVALKQGKAVNIVPELKHPSYHSDLYPNHPRYFEDTVLDTLKSNGYPLRHQDKPACFSVVREPSNKPGCPKEIRKPVPCGKVVLQNFDYDSLKYISTKVDRGIVDQAMLNDDNPYFFTYRGLENIAKYATWFGPWKEYLYVGPIAELTARNITWDQRAIDQLGGFIPVNEIVPVAHRFNLKVVLYTFYDSREPSHRGCSVKCEPEDMRAELRHYFKMGVDGLFVENINEAIQLRTEYHTELRFTQSPPSPRSPTPIVVKSTNPLPLPPTLT